MYVVGIDIGGTKISAGLVEKGKIIRKIKEQTKTGKRELIKQLEDIIGWCIRGVDKKKIKGIGIGVPGPANYNRGLIINPPNVRQLWNVNLKLILKKKFRTEIRIDNDVHVIALAELHYGLGKKLKNFFVMAIGTGIGGGIVINGEHYEGMSNAGEIGATIIDGGKKKTKAYGGGSLEGMASGAAIVRKSKKIFGRGIIASELAMMARKGNKKARKILEDTGRHLGIGLANIVNFYDPQLIILAGGVRESGNYILNAAKKELRILVRHRHCNVVWSKLADPGVVGAAALFAD